ncbi:MAG: haloacid dehalogenase type II [Planctomycetaceae bacterium]|jgi:2-haloacid dehalogenase|nr:haloacid dehalogenase type II [Planctomycetaceae bacterium]MBT6483935.1 haloacid dehalogenase type II [Planctomycetaceae bacterium]MBT6495170.1 haloacid dehalogenase type II [Planctomycetaceae bacterium]
MKKLENVKALTFDLFGTVLDLAGSLTPHIAEFLQTKGSPISPEAFWQQWRQRQRIEQYQDNIVMMGHSGYQTVARRACIYTLKRNGFAADEADVNRLIAAWQLLSPFPEVVTALERLQDRFQLVALSNGEPDFLEHLAANRIGWEFDRIISVQVVGAFKPHPGVYRRAAGLLGLELSECLMVSANSFDVMGARMCGYRGAFVNREGLPFEETEYQPDVTVDDFTQLADVLIV